MIRARSARLRRVVAARTHAASCARSCAPTANLVATAMPCLHHAITGMASELTRRNTRHGRRRPRGAGAVTRSGRSQPLDLAPEFGDAVHRDLGGEGGGLRGALPAFAHARAHGP